MGASMTSRDSQE